MAVPENTKTLKPENTKTLKKRMLSPSILSILNLLFDFKRRTSVLVRFMLIGLFIFGLEGAAFAQQTDFDAIVQPVDIKARDFSEYLV